MENYLSSLVKLSSGGGFFHLDNYFGSVPNYLLVEVQYCSDMFSYAGLCSLMHNYVQLCSVMCSYVELSSVMFNYVQLCAVMFDNIQLCSFMFNMFC